MTIRINESELNNRASFQDSKTLRRICNHVNGFGESDYRHIADGILQILKQENLIKNDLYISIKNAYKEMMKGNRISHIYFNDGEFLYLDNGIVKDEKGNNFEDGFEMRLKDESFHEGWRVVS